MTNIIMGMFDFHGLKWKIILTPHLYSYPEGELSTVIRLGKTFSSWPASPILFSPLSF